MYNTLQSGVAIAERVFDLLDADRAEPGPGRRGPACPGRPGRVEFSTSRSATSPTSR